MEYINPKFSQNVPPYPTPNYQNRITTSSPKSLQSALTSNEKFKQDGEDTFISSILRSSIGKTATLYFSYPDSIKWRDMVYTGVLELIGEDYIILRKPEGNYQILLMLYLEWIEFPAL